MNSSTTTENLSGIGLHCRELYYNRYFNRLELDQEDGTPDAVISVSNSATIDKTETHHDQTTLAKDLD